MNKPGLNRLYDPRTLSLIAALTVGVLVGIREIQAARVYYIPPIAIIAAVVTFLALAALRWAWRSFR